LGREAWTIDGMAPPDSWSDAELWAGDWSEFVRYAQNFNEDRRTT
jgi:hypothetical protein